MVSDHKEVGERGPSVIVNPKNNINCYRIGDYDKLQII